MTPRALLTAIGATAIGFALVLGTLATSGATDPATTATTTRPNVIARPLASDGAFTDPRLVAWNDPCVVAL